MIYKVATMMAMFGAAAAEHWAVIVAGSAGYGNYRHQADACHAYQVVTAGGIKPENVILLAVDDIANYRTNPFPGQVFNKPTDAGTPGVDVYDGCVIDYKGTDVTPETFTKVLTGDDSAGGKVLKSGADDRVFVNFVDHGAVGLIGFPTSRQHRERWSLLREVIKRYCNVVDTHPLLPFTLCAVFQMHLTLH